MPFIDVLQACKQFRHVIPIHLLIVSCRGNETPCVQSNVSSASSKPYENRSTCFLFGSSIILPIKSTDFATAEQNQKLK